jgi:putative PIN family toxin of toxin-antitoxin system
MRRAVVDTTVLVSAFLRPGGLADELLTLAAERQFELVLSSSIIIETWRKLISGEHIRTRYPFSDERVHLFCLSLSQISVDVLRSTQPLTGIVRDPHDDMIVACAVDGSATLSCRATRIFSRSVLTGRFL